MAKGDRDPPWVPRHKLTTMEWDWSRPDRMIIYDGNGPSAQDDVWTSGASRVAWIDVTGRGKVRVPNDAGWCVYRRSVKHSDLGGVTDAIFSCFLVSKFGEDRKPAHEYGPHCARLLIRQTEGEQWSLRRGDERARRMKV